MMMMMVMMTLKKVMCKKMCMAEKKILVIRIGALWYKTKTLLKRIFFLRMNTKRAKSSETLLILKLENENFIPPKGQSK